ncbi:MAG: hypothetical protein H6721_27790 [Sandaracinus sp.]|nr:hypothetical protein [Sandaracinus sp.]MCB9635929.1 hypothetical protein [Sandaracinus sp.]
MLVLVGCSTSLTSLQPARITPAGHVSVTTSAQVTPPVGLPGEVRDELEELRGSGNPNAARMREIAAVAGAALLAPPAGDGQLAVSAGLSKRLELGARVRSTSAGAGLRFQWLRRSPGLYGAIGLNVDGSFRAFPVERFASRVDLRSFRRLDVSIPLVVGYSRQHVHVWAGPKIVWSRANARFDYCSRRVDGECVAEVPVTARGHALFTAGQLGVAVGSNRFWVAFELTIARARVQADLDLQMSGSAMEHEIDRRGRVLTPALGLILWI